MEPKGKVAIVTGGASGIGRATSIALANAGAVVVVADLDEAGAKETVRSIEHAGGKAAIIAVDVRERADLEHMVKFAEEKFGGLDIVHNNAGVGTPGPRFPDAAPEGWERTLMIDLWAVIAATQASVSAMKRRTGGVIVNTASVAGFIGYEPDPIYAAAKHGVVGFTRSLLYLHAEANVRVNCVCPGIVDTPMLRFKDHNLTHEEMAAREAFLNSTPLMPPEQVSDAVLELIHNDALNGVALAVTYGQPPRLVDEPLHYRRDTAQAY